MNDTFELFETKLIIRMIIEFALICANAMRKKYSKAVTITNIWIDILKG